ncbi:MAG: right-handed parallel beta-helix repeat-containing protein [Deltaproteobacteria bacterium]|nr:right-handed parallel beta-helix repeat-containing protein [Deltaproteobacteria bacterium]
MSGRLLNTRYIMACLFVFFSISGCSLIAIEETLAGNDYYISPTGDDTAGDGLIGTPWATLKKAEASISAGDTVYCRGGTYLNHPRVKWDVVGTSISPITVKAYPGETPVFSSQGAGLFIAVRGVGWVTFDGLEVKGYKNAFNTRGLPYVDDTADTVTDYAENITIRNCYMHDTDSHGIYVSAGSKNIVINNNVIEDVAEFGIHNWHNPGADGLEVYNNLLINCKNNFAIGAWDGKNIKIYNNTVIGGFEGLSIYQNKTPSNYEIIVKNNIFYLPTLYVIHERYEDGSASNITFDNNVFYKPSGTFAYWNHAKVETLSASQTISGGIANSNKSDPLFANVDNGNYDLKRNSPAIDTGAFTDTSNYDYDGNPRPHGFGHDIGAYEASFLLSNSGAKSVSRVGSVRNTINASLVSGTQQSISYSTSGLPPGATASFTPAYCTPEFDSDCTTTLKIRTSFSSTTPKGEYTITVLGTTGEITKRTSFVLTVK